MDLCLGGAGQPRREPTMAVGAAHGVELCGIAGPSKPRRLPHPSQQAGDSRRPPVHSRRTHRHRPHSCRPRPPHPRPRRRHHGAREAAVRVAAKARSAPSSPPGPVRRCPVNRRRGGGASASRSPAWPPFTSSPPAPRRAASRCERRTLGWRRRPGLRYLHLLVPCAVVPSIFFLDSVEV